MKKISCYLMVLIACTFIAISSSGKDAVKDSIKKSIKESIGIKDSHASDVNLTDAVVQKLSNQEIVDIIKYKEELLNERKIAAVKDDQPPVPILLVVFGSIVLMILIPFYFGNKKTRSLHMLISNLAEKGHEIPKEIIFMNKKRRQLRTDFQRGIIFVAFGVSLCLVMYLSKVEDNYWTLGLIPLLIGIGLMLSYKIGNKSEIKTENKES
jgi:hypothetical protein